MSTRAYRLLEQGIATTAEGRLMYRMLAAIAEFQRDVITANTREGLAATQATDAQEKYDSRKWTVKQIADLYGVPCSTVYGYLTRGNRA